MSCSEVDGKIPLSREADRPAAGKDLSCFTGGPSVSAARRAALSAVSIDIVVAPLLASAPGGETCPEDAVKAVTGEIGRLASLAAAGAEWIGLAEGLELWPATDSAASTGDAHATAIESPPGKAAAVIPANWTAGWDFVSREAVEERRTDG
jgi:hypothetical protein